MLGDFNKRLGENTALRVNVMNRGEGSRRVNVEPIQGISRAAFAKRVEGDLAVWRKIVVDGNIKPE